MSKAQEISDIMYFLKLHTRVFFEVNSQSYVCEKTFPKGYHIICSETSYYKQLKNMTEVKKEITKLGKTIVCV